VIFIGVVIKEANMARMKKFKLSWKPSESDLLVGYKLYWSINGPVNYSSNSIKLSKINELDMPDIVVRRALSGESIYLGISAVDEMGNESDIRTLSEPYNFSVPQAPESFALIGLDDYKILEQNEQNETPIQSTQIQDAKQNDESIKQDGPRSPVELTTSERRTNDDFGMQFEKLFKEKC